TWTGWAKMSVSYEKLYRTACEEANCRINSAVVSRLAKASFRPLTVLNLEHNYLGPRGVLPVLKLLQLNGTVETVDLSHNGLDNVAVRELVAISRNHKGITSIDISHNACTQAVGKDLLSLVEGNTNIIELRVQGNDLYQALESRLGIALETNRAILKNLPHLECAQNTSDEHELGNLSTPGDFRANRTADVTAADRSPSTDTCIADTSASLGKVKPKPPPPTAASTGYRRMTPGEREEARQFYQRRLENADPELTGLAVHANQASSYTSAAAAVSAKARKKLEDLTRDDSSKIVGAQNQVAVLKALVDKNQEDISQSAKALLAAQNEKVKESEAEMLLAESALRRTAEIQSERDRLCHETERGRHHGDPRNGERENCQGADSEPIPNESKPVAQEARSQTDQASRQSSILQDYLKSAQAGGDRLADVVMRNCEDVQEVAEGPFMMPPNREPTAPVVKVPEDLDEQGRRFYELFNAGGAAYNAAEMDEAYQHWTEALEVAIEKKNREWVSIVNGNIQALSYQLLTCQGHELLDAYELEEASKCFVLARDVAVKARNAAWQRSADASVASVRKAQFKACYDAAAAIFDPLLRDTLPVQTPSVPAANADDEWARLLRLKEVLEHWAEARKFALQLIGRQRTELLQMISTVVRIAYDYQSAVTFCPAKDLRPTHSGNNTHLLDHSERERFIGLWEDVLTTAASLESDTWLCLVLNQLGNLHHASFRNKAAEDCFLKGIELAQQAQIKHLEASHLTHLARVHLGLARYTEAEELLNTADEIWRALRENPDGRLSPHDARYIVHQHCVCYELLQFIMVSQYRYHEALEMAERQRSSTHLDKLSEKMSVNFNTNTTVDHMHSLARFCESVLVVYSVLTRFEWNVDKQAADPIEQLCIWVIPPEGELKFVQINVTKDSGWGSLEELIDQVRESLCIMPDGERAAQGRPASLGVIVDAPEYRWKQQLRQLYDFLVYPISDFLTVNAGLEFAPHRKVVLVPSGILHLVPWPALMDADGKYLIERYNLQVSPSVQVLAMARLNATKLKPEDGQKLVVVNSLQEDETLEANDPLGPLYPFGEPVSDEGEVIAGELGCDLVTGPKETALFSMDSARLLHVSAEVLGDLKEGLSWGGFIASTGAPVSSRDVETKELVAELVVLPACNHSKSALLQGGDGVIELCRAFTCAGVPSLIYSMWATPHQSTSQVLLQFYALLRSQPDKALCLSQAQRHAAANDPYGPASWASLCLFGIALL
ncbi:TPR repeat-containing protein, partial [Diplonema papillatum]